jgi:hypothetical protein
MLEVTALIVGKAGEAMGCARTIPLAESAKSELDET